MTQRSRVGRTGLLGFVLLLGFGPATALADPGGPNASPSPSIARQDAVGGGRLGQPGVVVTPRVPPPMSTPTSPSTDPAPPAPPVPPPPPVSAVGWLVADLDTGDVLAAKDAHQRLRPASTLKMLTALALLPVLDPLGTYIGTPEDAAVEGSRAGIFPKSSYTIEQLWYALFLVSGNDAAFALAQAGGGLPATAAKMNAVAARLQARDTNAVNPSGLDADGQLSSAYDLALITRAGMGRADFRRYASTLEWPFPGKVTADGSPGPTFSLWNQNELLVSYPEAIAAKSGYTTLAHNTYAAVAERDGHRLVATLMGSHQGVAREARALLQWGFAQQARLAPVGVLVEPLPEPEASASERSSAAALLASPSPGPHETPDAGLTTSGGQSGSTPAKAWPIAAGVLVVGGLGATAMRLHLRRRGSRERS